MLRGKRSHLACRERSGLGNACQSNNALRIDWHAIIIRAVESYLACEGGWAGRKGEEALLRLLASWRYLPGWALQRVELLIPMLVKLPVLLLNPIQQPIVQHIRQICITNKISACCLSRTFQAEEFSALNS